MKITRRQLRRIIREAETHAQRLDEAGFAAAPGESTAGDYGATGQHGVLGGTWALTNKPITTASNENDENDEEDSDKDPKDLKERHRGLGSSHPYLVTRRQLQRVVREEVARLVREDKSGKGKCPADGCVQKRSKGWVIISNKTGECWGRSKKKGGECTYYGSREKAEAALGAYHVHK